MMLEPPSFIYGSSITLWTVRDDDNQIREIMVTGHADSTTCRRVSGLVMGSFLEKNRESEDFFVAGAAHLVDSGSAQQRAELLKLPEVDEYDKLERQRDLVKALMLYFGETPGVGTEGKSAIEDTRERLKAAEERLAELEKNPSVQEFLWQSRSADALAALAREADKFSAGNGLVAVRNIPSRVLDEAQKRVADASVGKGGPVVAFADLLEGDTKEAVLITNQLTVPEGRPLELRIPLARMTVASFNEARRNNRDGLEQAIVGNARQRLTVYNDSKQSMLEQQQLCENLTPEQRKEIVVLEEVTTREGVTYRPDKPKSMTRETYCKIQVPLNLTLVNHWTERVKELLKTVQEDARQKSGGRLQEFNYTTLIDSMLRDWRLPVARSQAGFDAWRKEIRRPVWTSLQAQLASKGVTPQLLAGEHLVFSVQIAGNELIVRPLHIVDLARSILVADPKAGATRLVDTWSEREWRQPDQIAAGGADSTGDRVRQAVRTAVGGNADEARDGLADAFSQDPPGAFRALEAEWLKLFPDTRESLQTLSKTLQPRIEVAEWQDAFNRLTERPEYKESPSEYLVAFDDMLRSYPKAPVDLHLELALAVAGAIAELQNGIDRQFSLPGRGPAHQAAPWDVLQAYAKPPQAGEQRKEPAFSLDSPLDDSPATSSDASARRREIEKLVRESGITDARQVQTMADLLEHSDAADPYQGGRKLLALKILTDPAPMIRKHIQEVQRTAPEYWAMAQKVRDLPKERSRDWRNADAITERPLTAFEYAASDATRLQETVQKAHWGYLAADYLWTTPVPNLSEVLQVVRCGIGDGRTGSTSAYLGPESTLKLFLRQRRALDSLTRVQSAASLEFGADALIALARAREASSTEAGPFRDSIPMRARMWYESGDFHKAIEALFPNRIPIALYDPAIRWEPLEGDAVTKPARVTASRQEDRIVFTATLPGKDGGTVIEAPVLGIYGLTPAAADGLIAEFEKVPSERWSELGKVSDQILLTPVSLPPAARSVRDSILEERQRLQVTKAMVYGRSGPGEELLGAPPKLLLPPPAVTDEVLPGGRAELKIPALEEVKQSMQKSLTEGGAIH
jgi:hypothetical protein